MLVMSVHLSAAARDPDPPVVDANPPFPRVSSCEGFFTLGHQSELVIGSEELMDHLIDAGVLTSEADIDAFDQPTFARDRAAAIALFKSQRILGRGYDLPPGMRLTFPHSAKSGQTSSELFTASMKDQPTWLAQEIRHAAIFNRHTYLAVRGNQVVTLESDVDPAGSAAIREIFAVRQSAAMMPTAADFEDLARAQRIFGHHLGHLVKVTGILWLTGGTADSLIIYR